MIAMCMAKGSGVFFSCRQTPINFGDRVIGTRKRLPTPLFRWLYSPATVERRSDAYVLTVHWPDVGVRSTTDARLHSHQSEFVMLLIRRSHCWLLLVGFVFAPATTLFADEPLSSRVDALIDAKLSGQPTAALADDAEFLRRVFLDFAGRIPSAAETREFLKDSAANKREKLIDKLLASDEFPIRLADLMHVALMERRGEHPEWIAYLRESFKQNKSWDVLAREMISPDPKNEQTRASAFFLSKRLEHYGQNAIDYPILTRDVGRLFLGMDLQCAQCHDHLFIKDYKQDDFQGMYVAFLNTELRSDVKFPAVSEKLLTKKIEFQSVFNPQKKSIGPRVPGRSEITIPEFMKGEEYLEPPDKTTKEPGRPKFSPLEQLANQITAADNTQFAKSIANRMWFMAMGRGLVHPLDLHHSENPPSHPELLELLARELTEHKFDLKWLLRELAMTRTYQRSGVLPADAKEPLPEHFAVALEKPLSAEQLFASSTTAVGTKPTDVIKAKFLKAFANPPMEPEGEFAPSLRAALFLMNDVELLKLLDAQPENLLTRLKALDSPAAVADEVYISVLSRSPSADENADVTEQLKAAGDRKEAVLKQLVWALLASSEFCLNH